MYTPETLKKLGQAVRSPVGEAMQAHADAWQADLDYRRNRHAEDLGMAAAEKVLLQARETELLGVLKLLLQEYDALPQGMPKETLGKMFARAVIKKAEGGMR